MLAMSDIIDFLLALLRDDDARAEFERDPDGALQDAGLDGLTAQDVRDAQLLLSDSGAARPDSGSASSSRSGGDSPVQEITYTTQHYQAAEDGPASVGNIINIDDRDTTIINDSFNDIDVTDIDIQAEDSFNKTVENDVIAIQDNDTIINDNDTVEVEDNDTVIEGDVIAGPPGSDPGPAQSNTADPASETVDEEEVSELEEAPDLAAVSGPADDPGAGEIDEAEQSGESEAPDGIEAAVI